MSPTQTNTKEGPIRVLAGEDLTGKEGYIVKMTHDTGIAEVVLPNDVADDELYLLLEGGEDGDFVTIEALSPHKQYRVKLDGTCNPGDELTLGAIDATNDGKVRTLPVAADTYFVFLRAEEKGVDEQLVLVRPIMNARAVVVT